MLIGLTGRIGSGKSTVSSHFKNLGYTVIDSDAIVRELYKPNSLVCALVNDSFDDVLDAAGGIDRRKLAAIVFNDKSKLDELNALVHPYVRVAEEVMIQNCNEAIIILDSPLLIESGRYTGMDKTILVTTDSDAKIIKRISKRNPSLSRKDIIHRLKSQIETKDAVKYVDYIIKNDASIVSLEVVATKIMREIKNENSSISRKF
jgi:dephospho-CoA kinase